MSLFDLPTGEGTELLPYDGSAVIHLDVLSAAEARAAFVSLHDEIEFHQNHLRMFGREIPEPRLVAWVGDPNARYSYSGIELDPAPWTPTMSMLRKICERVAATTFNSALINLYRNGMDSIGWHSDDEPALGSDPTIASLSLGAQRRFDFRHKVSCVTVGVDLPPGSVVVMSAGSQGNWSHRIAKTKRVNLPRINLTFRSVRSEARGAD